MPGTLRLLVTVIAALNLAGCTHWRPYVPSPAADASVVGLPDPLRLSLNSGTSVVLNQAILEADSVIIGVEGNRGMRRIPVSQVVGIENQEFNVGGTMFLVIVGGVAGLWLVVSAVGGLASPGV